MLKQRVITGLILAVSVASAIYFLPTTDFAQLSLVFIVGFGLWEWFGLTGVHDWVQRGVWVLLGLALSELLLWIDWPILPLLLLSVLIWGFILSLLFLYKAQTNFYKKHPWLLRFIGYWVLIPAWYALVYLHAFNFIYVFYVISLIAFADIGAYFAGKRFGKHKLAPELSPGKTWEGALGGFLLTLVWACVGAALSTHSVAQGLIFVFFSMLAVLISISGDLFESMVKRQAGAKDSGRLLPGHGGVLDRIDGLVAALPVFTLGLYWAYRMTPA